MRRRICISGHRKRERPADAPPDATLRAGSVGSPVFAGSIHLANLTLDGNGGPWSVPASDLHVVLEYLSRAAPPIQAYASQYGPARLEIAPALLPINETVRGGRYSDADLRRWVDTLVAGGGLPSDAAVIVLNPPGAVNTDAQERGGIGVLGYHGRARVPFSFVNLLGTGFAVADSADYFAEALSHEVAEMTVDPLADDRNPEVCDGCGTNCQGARAFRIYFGSNGEYLGGSTEWPPSFPYDFFLSAIARPTAVRDCPAAEAGCVYPPP